ncbi:MAG: glycosyltransferase family 2 protein [Waddliaceae bacterium]
MEYSILIPLKDEEGNIDRLIDEIEQVMDPLSKSWELICVDDGSSDQTLAILEKLATMKPYLRILVFTRNFGQSSAFDAGFKIARGEFLITIDGDGQNDPADIPKLIEASKDCDLVCGIRHKRMDSLVKKLTSALANGVRRWVCRDGITDSGCSLKLYRRQCLKNIKMYHGMHRFLPALFQAEGFRVKEIPVNHRKRIKGASKYHFRNRSFNTISDMLAVRWMKKRSLRYTIEKEIP